MDMRLGVRFCGSNVALVTHGAADELLRTPAAPCQVHLTTALRWRHRFLKLADSLSADVLTGSVEADQTEFRESFKGQRRIPQRAVRKRGNAHKQAASWIPVLVAPDRSHCEADSVLDHCTRHNVERCLIPRPGADIVLCTDGHLTFDAPSSLSDLTLIYCGKADFGHFARSFLLNRTTIRLKRVQKLPQNGLSLATIGQVRQAASSLSDLTLIYCGKARQAASARHHLAMNSSMPVPENV